MTPANPDFSPQDLLELLLYDPDTGRLFWRKRPLRYCTSEAHWKRWNKQFAGKEAFCMTSRGYRRGMVLGHHLFAHRVIWAMTIGEWPKSCIDHIDGDPNNNRISNLRAVNPVENSKNRALSTRNASGVLGVHHVQGKGYRVNIGRDKTSVFIGYYDTLCHAEIARDAAQRALGYYAGHGRRKSKALIAQEEV